MFCVSSALTNTCNIPLITDLLSVISIPILLLWSVRINLRRKFGLASLLCLSIFAIITNIIRASGHKLNNDLGDVIWIRFWLEMEACVAVTANSMTAFRSLFTAHSSGVRNPPQDQEKPRVLRMGRQRRPAQVNLPTLPAAKLSGLRSMMLQDPFEDHEPLNPESNMSPSLTQVANSLDTATSHQSQSTNRVSALFNLPKI